jgi:hypothetical protein
VDDYRLYFHDDQGHIVSSAEFTCMDDDEAKANAESLLGGEPGELWQLARKVAAFEAGGQPTRPSSERHSPSA